MSCPFLVRRQPSSCCRQACCRDIETVTVDIEAGGGWLVGIGMSVLTFGASNASTSSARISSYLQAWSTAMREIVM